MKSKNKITIEELNSSSSSVSNDSLSGVLVENSSGRSALGLMPPTVIGLNADIPLVRYFITVALPHKEKVAWNNRRIEYKKLMTREQHIYLSRRLLPILDDLSADYLLVFEHCDSGDLHCHITLSYRGCKKDLTLSFCRGLDINLCKYPHAVDARIIYDEEHLKDYLQNKNKKKYQTSIFPKIEKKPIEEFN
jgi:hypothetical protein